MSKIATQIAVLLVFSASVAFVANAVRDDRLPLVMPFPPTFQCPSSEKSGDPLSLEQALALFGKPGTLFVDVRRKEAFQQGHIEGARHIPYSFVEPLSKEIVESLKGYSSIIVYCNGEEAEVSKLMTGELVQAGINGAVYLEKGFAGWVKKGGRYTGTAPEGYDK